MAELLKCNKCGFETVRCGMANHIKRKHLEEYKLLDGRWSDMTTSLGKITCAEFRDRKKR